MFGSFPAAMSSSMAESMSSDSAKDAGPERLGGLLQLHPDAPEELLHLVVQIPHPLGPRIESISPGDKCIFRFFIT